MTRKKKKKKLTACIQPGAEDSHVLKEMAGSSSQRTHRNSERIYSFLKMRTPANNHTFYLVSLKKFLGKQTSMEPTSLEPWDVT